MDVPFRVQQDVVRLHISMHDAHAVYVSQRATQLRDPEAHRLLCEGFSRDVKAKVTARHEIDDKVSVQTKHNAVSAPFLALKKKKVYDARTYKYSTSWKLYRRLQRKG